MPPAFVSESWEQSAPSYIQSYVASAFLLAGFLGVSFRQVPLTPLTGLFFTAWCGTLLYWLVQNGRAERCFASDRVTIADGRVTHSFRYTVTEAVHSQIDVADLTDVRIHTGMPIGVELIGSNGSDFLFLPNLEQADQFRSTLLQLNPGIRFP